MKKLTKKLLISMFAVIFAAVAMVTSAYAWFTIGGTVTASAFEADVTAGEGVEINLGGTTDYANDWYSNISSTIMNTYLAQLAKASADATETNLTDAGFKFLDLTSADGETIQTMGGTEATAFSGGYISFTVNFRSTTPGSLVLDTATTITSTGVAWQADATVTNPQAGTDYAAGITAGEISTLYAANAVRMSFTSGDTTIILGQENYGAVDANNNAYKSFGPAVAEDNTVTSYTPTSFAAAYAKAKGFAATPSTGFTVPTLTAMPTDTSKPTVVSAFTAPSTAEEGETANGYYTASVTVKIWIEGWDADCINAILGDTVSVALAFSKVEAE